MKRARNRPGALAIRSLSVILFLVYAGCQDQVSKEGSASPAGAMESAGDDFQSGGADFSEFTPLENYQKLNLNTIITAMPAQVSDSATATFKFRCHVPAGASQCKLDHRQWRKCRSPKTYTGLNEGAHIFKVKGTNNSGKVDCTPTEYGWTIDLCIDNDGDGYGTGMACSGSDCDDSNGNIHPGADDVCGNGIDEDCCGGDCPVPLICIDNDEDGYGDNCPPGPDCDDADPDNWNKCSTCRDLDYDGWYKNCDQYLDRSGPDCDDSDFAEWECCDCCPKDCYYYYNTCACIALYEPVCVQAWYGSCILSNDCWASVMCLPVICYLDDPDCECGGSCPF